MHGYIVSSRPPWVLEILPKKSSKMSHPLLFHLKQSQNEKMTGMENRFLVAQSLGYDGRGENGNKE